MKPHRILFTVASLALAFLFTFAVLNATAAAAKPAAPPPIDPRKLVKSVDAKSSTLVIQYMRDKTLHTYTIDDLTTLKVNNEAGKISDIKPGMVVDDFLERTDTILDSLTLSGYGAEPAVKPAATPKPKPKPKPTTPPPAQT